ncbi:MAG: ATP-binding protein, partial [Bacteroidales bacterium]|nr:ATP-binding protein [Bacteroidales bacterium]
MKIPKVIKNRDAYISRIKPFMRQSIVKVMIGHRRVGKSYILYQLMDVIRKEDTTANIIYINKEDVEFADMRTYKELNDYVISKSVDCKMNYIFVDEIQEITDFRLAIRSLALDDNNDIYITGSNSEIFSADLANELGGRYVEFKIYSLSYMEFLDFHKLPDEDKSMESYIHYGGLPYLIHLPMQEEVVMEYLSSIYSTIVLKDVVQRKNIRNTAFLEQLIKFLANNVGSLFSSKSISDFLKSQRVDISPNQVNEYAIALADAFIVHRVGRYDIVGKRLFERGEKYYFENMGIRNVIA